MTKKSNLNEFEEKLRETLKGKTQLDVLLALLTQGVCDDNMKALWMFYTLLFLKKIHDLIAFVVSGISLIVIYFTIMFIVENKSNMSVVFDRVGAFALSLVILYGLSKMVRKNTK